MGRRTRPGWPIAFLRRIAKEPFRSGTPNDDDTVEVFDHDTVGDSTTAASLACADEVVCCKFWWASAIAFTS